MQRGDAETGVWSRPDRELVQAAGASTSLSLRPGIQDRRQSPRTRRGLVEKPVSEADLMTKAALVRDGHFRGI